MHVKILKINEKIRIKKFANFRNKSVVLGEKVVAMGYPYGKTVSSEIKLTSGSVSSLSGLGDEFTRMQIDAALQPGNSGGPLFDDKANLIGINSSGLNKNIADNVGYSIKTTLFFPSSFLEKVSVICTIAE